MSLLPSDKAERSLDKDALDTLFTFARTANGFLDAPVPPETLERLVEAAHLGPTAMNSTPMRVLFIQSIEAKERLRPALGPRNVEKMMQAPVTAIIGHDTRFFEHLPKLFPHLDASHIGDDPESAAQMASYNAALQTGYFIIAARAFGLDTGPMGGFDRNTVDREFFPDGRIKSDVLINLGYGDDSKLFPRNPRLNFEEVASYV